MLLFLFLFNLATPQLPSKTIAQRWVAQSGSTKDDEPGGISEYESFCLGIGGASAHLGGPQAHQVKKKIHSKIQLDFLICYLKLHLLPCLLFVGTY